MSAARLVCSTPAMSNRGANRRTRRRRSGGQSLVEFALVVPIFLAVLFGIIDFGWLLYSRVTLINATREGARAAIVMGDNPTAIDEDLNSTGGPIRAATTGLVNSDLTITVTCLPAATLSACDYTAGGGREAATGDSVVVTTSYVYRSFFARVFGATVNLGTSMTMVIE